MNFYTMKINIGIFRSILQLQTIFAFHFILFKSTYFFRKRQKCQVFTHFPSKSNKMNLYVFKEIYSICRSRHRQFRVSKKCKMKGPKTVQLQDNFYCYYEIAISSLQIEQSGKTSALQFLQKKSGIEIGLEATRTIVQIQQFFFNSTELGKIEEQN